MEVRYQNSTILYHCMGWRLDINRAHHTMTYQTMVPQTIPYHYATPRHSWCGLVSTAAAPKVRSARLCGPAMNCIWWKQLRCKFGSKIQIQIEIRTKIQIEIRTQIQIWIWLQWKQQIKSSSVGYVSWRSITLVGGGHAQTHSLLAQELWHGLSASWESSIWEKSYTSLGIKRRTYSYPGSFSYH